jgi:hypothetical protein
MGFELNPLDDEQPTREEWEDFESRGCWNCGGRGWMVTCIDDLCHGQDECIHGDPPTPCRVCNKDGKNEDSYL